MLKGLAEPNPKPSQIDAWAGLTEATGAKYISRLTFETLWAPNEVAPRTNLDAPGPLYDICIQAALRRPHGRADGPGRAGPGQDGPRPEPLDPRHLETTPTPLPKPHSM